MSVELGVVGGTGRSSLLKGVDNLVTRRTRQIEGTLICEGG